MSYNKRDTKVNRFVYDTNGRHENVSINDIQQQPTKNILSESQQSLSNTWTHNNYNENSIYFILR